MLAGAAAVTAVLLSTLLACEKPQGPAEHAGKEIDKAVDSAGKKIERAGDRVQEAAKPDKK